MYPGANNTELCPTRFFTGDPLYREGRAPDAAEIDAAPRRLLAAVPRRARAPSSTRLRAEHGHAVLFDGHSIKSELPWLFEGRLPDLNLGTAGGAQLRAVAARRAGRACWPRSAASAMSSTAASRAATSRATTAGRRSACTRCSSRCAGAATWTRRRPYAYDDATGRRSTVAAGCCAALRWRAAEAVMASRRRQRCSGRRAPGSPAAGATACCCASAPTAAGAEVDGRCRRAAARRAACCRAACCRASSTRTATPSSAPSPASPNGATRRSDDFWSWRDRMYARRAAHHARSSCARSRRSSVRRAAARRLHAGLRVPLPAARPRRQPLRRPAGDVVGARRRGRRGRHRPDAAAGAVRARRLRRAGAARRPAPLRDSAPTDVLALPSASRAAAAARRRRRRDPFAARGASRRRSRALATSAERCAGPIHIHVAEQTARGRRLRRRHRLPADRVAGAPGAARFALAARSRDAQRCRPEIDGGRCARRRRRAVPEHRSQPRRRPRRPARLAGRRACRWRSARTARSRARWPRGAALARIRPASRPAPSATCRRRARGRAVDRGAAFERVSAGGAAAAGFARWGLKPGARADLLVARSARPGAARRAGRSRCSTRSSSPRRRVRSRA